MDDQQPRVVRRRAGSRTAARRRWNVLLLAVAMAVGVAVPSAGAVQEDGRTAAAEPVPLTLDVTAGRDNAHLGNGLQGFSVESADFAHGFLTEQRMAQRLKTLGGHGAIRLGGYSMDLVWPAFGAWAGTQPPPEAIGGTVDQADMDALGRLLRATGWKATLGVPLKSLLDPSKIKNPAKDPSPKVTMDQVMAEVKAARDTLGDDLLSVEIGNEYDNVTTLTEPEMWDQMKRYEAAIRAAVPKARIKVAGPSANTAGETNTKLDAVTATAKADTSVDARDIVGEWSSHLYAGSHCGTNTMTIPQLMSPDTHTLVRGKLRGIKVIDDRFGGRIPVTLNESNSASCSGQPGVSDSYATSLWSLDYLMQAGQSGLDRLQFHTNTAAVCGDFKPRESPDYPISYRYYGAFCAADQAELDAGRLSATPLYYGLWAFRQVPQGRYVDVGLADGDLGKLRAYGVEESDGTLTMVLINVQDPAADGSATDDVTLDLPSSYRSAHQVTLRSTGPDGLASLDASRITLGDRSIDPAGVASGKPVTAPVTVDHTTATTSIPAGTAQIVTLRP